MRKNIALLNFLFALVWASSFAAIIQNGYPWQAEPSILWHELQQASLVKLQTELKGTTERTHAAWLKLAIVYQQNRTSTKNLINQLIEWRAEYPDHPGNTADIPWIFHKKINKTHLQYDRFYAVGLDAYLLSQELNRLIELPLFPMLAETGTLSLNQHSVYRELPWSQMHAKQS